MAGRPLARGDLVLVPFPFTDLSATRLRPAVVVWSDPAGRDVVLAFVSSRRIGHGGIGELVVLPTHPEFAFTGLVTSSTIRATKLVTLERRMVRRWLGRLGPLLTADLDRALVTVLGINIVAFREEGHRDERTRLLALHGSGGTAAVLADLGATDS